MDECSRRLHQLDNNPVGIQCQMKFYLTRKRALVHTQLIAYSSACHHRIKTESTECAASTFCAFFFVLFSPQYIYATECTKCAASTLYKIGKSPVASPGSTSGISWSWNFSRLGAGRGLRYIHTCIHTSIHTYIHTQTHTYIHTNIHHTYIRICIHTYVYSYVCTYIINFIKKSFKKKYEVITS